MKYKLFIFKSNKHINLQIINIEKNFTLISKSTCTNKFKKKYNKLTKSQKSIILIKKIILFLKKKNIKKILINYKCNKYLGINKIIFDKLKINNIFI